ncbi:MAG: hypothetical protein HRU09_04770 [Oligoflexales bacterium]|nr:hypothetical protein [Oligoflexales bacterium]
MTKYFNTECRINLTFALSIIDLPNLSHKVHQRKEHMFKAYLITIFENTTQEEHVKA